MAEKSNVGKYHAMQTPEEEERFIALLKQEGVRSYLEIGSKYGGSLWMVGMALPVVSRIVSVDLFYAKGRDLVRPELSRCLADLRNHKQDVHMIVGDSRSPKVIEQVRKLGPFDCVFIDGDHRAPVPEMDWNTYGPMGRIVAIHDIAYKQRSYQPPGMIDVPALWEKIKGQYRHEEIIHNNNDYHGIGVIWR